MADLLIIVCSPTQAPLPGGHAELNAVRRVVEAHGQVVEERIGCTAEELRQALSELRPRMLLFIGHGDALHPVTGERTLGLTDGAGKVIRLRPETLAEVLSQAERLELVVLNGCDSAALGEAVAVRGVIAVCWATKLLDAVAEYFSVALFDELLRASHSSGAPLFERLPRAFEQAQLAITAAHGRMKSGKRARTDTYVIADPNDYPARGELPDGRYAAGVPVCLRRWWWPSGTPIAKRPPALHVTLPGGSACFTGQEHRIEALREHFFPLLRSSGSTASDAAAIMRQSVVQPQVVRGLGGLGKTELAVQYARGQWTAGAYANVLFVVVPDTPLELARLRADRRANGQAVPSEREMELVDGNERELLRRLVRVLPISPTEQATLAREADVEGLRAAASGWFGANSRWLLLVDNADDAAALGPGTAGFVRRCLPSAEAPGHVLLTSRVGTAEFGALGVAAPLELQLLSSERVGEADSATGAEVLLLRHARAMCSRQTDLAVAAELAGLSAEERAAVSWLAGCQGLAGLPLALAQAGDAIREAGGEHFAGYREMYQQLHTAAFADAPVGLNREEQSVHTTFRISFQRLEADSKAAAEVLSLCAYTAPDAIPLSLFTRVGVDAAPALHTALHGTALSEAARDKHLLALVRAAQRYSLLAPSGSTVSVHRLVQRAIQAQLEALAIGEPRVKLTGRIVADALPRLIPLPQPLAPALAAVAKLLPHAAEALEHEARLGGLSANWLPLELHDRVAEAHLMRGEYAEAVSATRVRCNRPRSAPIALREGLRTAKAREI